MNIQTRRQFLQSSGALLAASVVRAQTAPRRIRTIAGTGMAGSAADGDSADRGAINNPFGLVIGPDGALYLAVFGNNRVRRVDARTGVITTFAGTGEAKPTPDEGGLLDTPTRGPRSIEFAPDGSMYLVLREGNAVFTIDPARARLKRFAGTGEFGYSGDGGPAIAAKFGAPGNAFNGPKGVAYSADGSLYVTDTENHAIRRIDLRSGFISTVVGTGQRGDGPDGDARTCKLARPQGVFISGRTIYIGDSENHRIRLLES